VLLNVGWYKYYANNDTYVRKGCHWVTVVGYGINGSNLCEDCLIIHDPAPRAGEDFQNQYITLEKITSGRIKHPNEESATSFYKIEGMVNKRDYIPIADTVVEFDIVSIHELDFLGKYEMIHDGKWKGILTLKHNPSFDNDAICDNIKGSYKALWNGKSYEVYGRTLKTTLGDNFCNLYNIESTDCNLDVTLSCNRFDDRNASNKIQFYIEFPERQRFDGYLFTWTKDAMAGITWWYKKPFGFYAIKKMPDLIVKDLEVNGSYVEFKVANVGKDVANASKVYIYVDGRLIDTKAIGEIAPSSYVVERFECIGKHVCTVKADGGKEVDEINEGNNYKSKILGVSNLPLINPIHSNIYFTSAKENPGSIYEYNTLTKKEKKIFTRERGQIYSFAFHPEIPEKLYFVNANDNKIYLTLYTAGIQSRLFLATALTLEI